MSADSALAANAAAAGSQPAASPQQQPRKLNLQQESLVGEFVTAYGIDADQVIFFDDTPAPFFLFEALAQIVGALGNFREVAVTHPEIDERNGNATCEAALTLDDGRVVRNFGSSFVGDTIPGKEVNDFQTAFDIARARALRSALRLAGFDPVKRHEQSKRGEKGEETVISPEAEQRNKELAEIHALAAEAGLIVNAPGALEDKSAYYRQLQVFFPAVSSAGELSAKERAQFIALLRGIKSARERAS
ncbi:MAG: hypothetical protein ABW208_07310 [Pyrinomonadaceae bacterium]